MPQFTQWNVPDPTPNVLFNPMAVDESIAKQQSELGTLDINRQRLGLEQRKLDLQQAGGQSLIDSLKGTTPPTDTTASGGGAGADGSFLGALAAIESGDKNIVSGTDKDSKGLTLAQGGNPSEISQGHFQIQTATWRDFAKQAGVDVNQYPNAMSAPREVQARVASAIPLSRFGPRTQTLLRSRFGPLDTSQTVGALAGTPALTFAPGTTGPRVAGAPPPPFNLGFDPLNPMQGAPSLTGQQPDVPAPGAPTVTGQTDPANMAAVKQAATALLSMPEADAATAYPGVVKDLQARGFAMNAPPDYPGHAALQAIVGQADAPVPVAPSPVALRTGGTDFAGPGGGPVTMGPVDVPNTLYQTGLPGVSIRGPGNGLAPPPVTTAQAAPAAPVSAPAGAAPPGMATRPPPVQPPAAPSRVIPLEPVLPNGLTASQVRLAGAMVQSGAPVADVAAHLEQWKQANRSGQQQAATQAALDAQATFERQKYYQQQQIEAEKTQYQRQQDAIKNQREEIAAKNAGLPPGYRMDDKGVATRIDGLPPDPAVAEAAKAAFEAEQRKQPFQGNSEDAQNRNILLTGDPKSPAYHSAYASFADPKTQEGGLIVKHNMQPYRMPQDQEGNPITTYDQPSISIGPGDLTKLRAFETGAATLKSALDDFAKTSRNASAGEWTATVAGQPTDLSAAWTNAALMAKGTALYELGVLSGPDMTVLRGALADPSTFRGAIASNATIDKQVARIKGLLDTRLDQARRSYGGGMSTSGTAPPAQAPPPANRPPLASFAR